MAIWVYICIGIERECGARTRVLVQKEKDIVDATATSYAVAF